MKTGKLRKINVTSSMISLFARGCPINNPVAFALKENNYPEATEIVVTPEEWYQDGELLVPRIESTRWLIAWNKGRKVEPCILGFYEH